MLNGLGGDYKIDHKLIRDFASSYQEVELPRQLISDAAVRDAMSKAYTKNQLEISNGFIEQLLSTEDAKDAKKLVVKFQEDVVSSDLSRAAKIELLVLASNVSSLADFFEQGGVRKIKNALFGTSGPESFQQQPPSTCKFSFKYVVKETLFGGAFGLIAGAAGGATLSFWTGPGVLPATALGALGGFVTGAVTGGLNAAFKCR